MSPPRKVNEETRQAFFNHLEQELGSPEPTEAKLHLLHLWVVGLVENADLYPQWFEPKTEKKT